MVASRDSAGVRSNASERTPLAPFDGKGQGLLACSDLAAVHAAVHAVLVSPALEHRPSTGSRPCSGQIAASAAGVSKLSPALLLHGSNVDGSCGTSCMPLERSPPPPRSTSAAPPAPRHVKAVHMMQLHPAGWPPPNPGVKGLLQRRRCARATSFTPVPPAGIAPSSRRTVSSVAQRPSSTSAAGRLSWKR